MNKLWKAILLAGVFLLLVTSSCKKAESPTESGKREIHVKELEPIYITTSGYHVYKFKDDLHSCYMFYEDIECIKTE